jgi:hypothetical protein
MLPLFSAMQPLLGFFSGKLARAVETSLNTVQILAIVTAAVWTYYHFIKGRTFHSRLNLDLTLEAIPSELERTFLKIGIRAKNVGPSRITFSNDESVLYVMSGKSIKEHSTEIRWLEDIKVSLPLLTEHTWVESGEEIYEERLVCMRGTEKSFKVIARFRSENQKRTATAVTRNQQTT